MAMQKRYVLGLVIVAGAGLLSAQQGPACPYQEVERAAAQPTDSAGVTDGTPSGGSLLSIGRSAFYAP
jgi:hypothetical protein